MGRARASLSAVSPNSLSAIILSSLSLVGKVREEKGRRKKIREQRERESQAKEDTGAQTGGKVAKHCVFPCSSRVWKRKSRLAKASGVQPSGEMRDEKIRCRCNAKHISK